MRRRALAIAALAAAGAVAGCAPVGPDFMRPAALVSPQFKEIAGWKVATPRAGETKGDWWSVFHDPELARLEEAVAISNQTVKSDEANYREALALINEARAGLYPTVNGTGSATRSNVGGTAGTTLTAEASGMWTLDVWGQVRREIEAQTAGAEFERRQSGKRLAHGAVGARPCLHPGARGGLARGPADQDRHRIQAFALDHAKPVQRGHRGQVRRHHRAGPGAQRPGPACRRGGDSRPERACGRDSDGPTARGTHDLSRLARDPHPLDSGQPAVVAARAPARRGRRRGNDAPEQRRDRRCLRGLFPGRVDLRPGRLFRQPVRRALRPFESGLVV